MTEGNEGFMNWLHAPTADDVMMRMYARAVGLSVMDYSGSGEPFGKEVRRLEVVVRVEPTL